MKVFAVILICLICVSGLVFVAYFIGVTSDDRRLDIERETALIRAETERDATRADGQVKVINAQTRLENARMSTDPQIRQAMRTRAYLSAWFPVYFPLFLIAGVATLTATYYTFRLVEYKDDSIQTKVRVFDSAKLVDKSLQVKAIEAAQGVDVLQLAENISHRQLSAFGGMVRGLRGIMGRENVTINNALPPANIEQSVNVPTFQQAVSDMKPGHVLLGYDLKNEPVHFKINQFVSCALAGGSGSGKTTKERFFVGQMAVNGVRVHILDAHAGDAESLVNSLGDICKLPNVTTYSPIDTRDTIQFFLHDLEEAKKHPEEKQTTIYVIDELLPIIDAVPETSDFILKVATEGRKYERFGMISGQVWPASLFGKGSSVRDALMLKMSAKLPLEQARILFKSKEKAQTVERLRLPEMYASSMNFQGVVTVPFCSRDDLNSLAKNTPPKEFPLETQHPETVTAAEIDDALLIRRIKERFPRNNELARLIERDKGQVSDALNNGKLTASLRNAFTRLLQNTV